MRLGSANLAGNYFSDFPSGPMSEHIVIKMSAPSSNKYSTYYVSSNISYIGFNLIKSI